MSVESDFANESSARADADPLRWENVVRVDGIVVSEAAALVAA